MKTITVRDLQKRIRKCVNDSQKERVVITRHGRPAAVLVGVIGQDWEQLALQLDPAFWRMIQRRRKEKTIPLEEVRRRLDARLARGRKSP